MTSSSWHLIGDAGSTDSWLLTTAIGENYFRRWETSASANWSRYADAHGFGIAVAVDDLWSDDEPRLNGSWQKLLALQSLQDILDRDVRCAVIDTDVFINPSSPSIFEAVEAGNVGVVSQTRGIPLPLERMQNRIAFLRRTFLDPEFPFDSLLNATPRQLFEWAGLSPAHDDYACAGVFVADTSTHADLFKNWYREAPESEAYVSLGDWEQTYFNHRVQQLEEVQWLDYKWQALWIFEVAAHYPFLYSSDSPEELAAWCAASSLLCNNFLHMAGGWESSLLREEQYAFPIDVAFEDFAVALATHEARESVGVMKGKLSRP